MILDVLTDDLGLTVILTDIRQPSGRRYTVRTIARAKPMGRHIVWIKDHVIPLVGGLVMDWTKDRLYRVSHVWTIE
jgi:hypothetical protein